MDPVNFTCSASGIPLPTLRWSQNNITNHISNERININVNDDIENNRVFSTLTIQSVRLEDEGSYICATLLGERTRMLTVYDLIVGKVLSLSYI